MYFRLMNTELVFCGELDCCPHLILEVNLEVAPALITQRVCSCACANLSGMFTFSPALRKLIALTHPALAVTQSRPLNMALHFCFYLPFCVWLMTGIIHLFPRIFFLSFGLSFVLSFFLCFFLSVPLSFFLSVFLSFFLSVSLSFLVSFFPLG